MDMTTCTAAGYAFELGPVPGMAQARCALCAVVKVNSLRSVVIAVTCVSLLKSPTTTVEKGLRLQALARRAPAARSRAHQRSGSLIVDPHRCSPARARPVRT